MTGLEEAGGISRRSLLTGLIALGLTGSAAIEVLAAVSATAASHVQYRYPFPLAAIFKHSSATHTATDFSYGVSRYDDIPAIANGTVTSVLNNVVPGGLGHRIEISHLDGAYSGYCHMDGPSHLNVGDAVFMGDKVGEVGNSGVSAYHLHLAMSFTQGAVLVGSGSNGYAKCFDPIPYIAARLSPPNRRNSMTLIFTPNPGGSGSTAFKIAIFGPAFWHEWLGDGGGMANSFGLAIGTTNVDAAMWAALKAEAQRVRTVAIAP